MRKISDQTYIGYPSDFLLGTIDEITARLKEEAKGFSNPRFSVEWTAVDSESVLMTYERPETEKEKATRLRKKAAAKKAKLADAEHERAADLKELARLQKKYGTQS